MNLGFSIPFFRRGSLRADPPITSKLAELQLLRAMAAGMVVWTHAIDWAGAAGLAEEFRPGTRALGAAGVDLFFIISGFIITRSVFYAAHPVGAAEFILRRLFRIVPLYWLWSAVVFTWQTASGNDFSSAQIVKTFVFFPWIETQGYVLPVLYLGWTLSYELVFYLAVAIVWRARLKQPYTLIMIGVGLAAFSSMARSPIAWVPFLVNPLWLEFCAGMLLAAHHERLRALPRSCGIGLVAIGIAWWIVAAMMAPPQLADVMATLDNRFSGARVAWWGGGALCLAAGVIVSGRSDSAVARQSAAPRSCDRIASTPGLSAGLIALGDASYTWYLSQAVTLPIAAHLWGEVVGGDRLLPFTLFAVATTGVFALVLARLIEFPLHRWSTAWVRKRFRDRDVSVLQRNLEKSAVTADFMKGHRDIAHEVNDR